PQPDAAAPDAAPPPTVKGGDDPRVRAFLAALPDTTAGERPGDKGHIQFAEGGRNYLGGYHRLRNPEAPPWVICTVVPNRDLLGQFSDRERFALAVAAGVLVAGLVLGWLLSGQIARPLVRLAREVAAVGNLELDSKPAPRSVVREVDRLAAATEE